MSQSQHAVAMDTDDIDIGQCSVSNSLTALSKQDAFSRTIDTPELLKRITESLNPAEKIIPEISDAIEELQFRGLHLSAQWLAELLVAVDEQSICASSGNAPMGFQKSHIYDFSNMSMKAVNSIRLAQTHFNVKQYRRCYSALESVENLHAGCPAAFFLKYYSLYLAGEKRREEESLENSETLNKPHVTNSELQKIADALDPLYQARELDPLLLYLHGIALKAMDWKNEARKLLIESLTHFPWNWSCWLDLISLCDDYDFIPPDIRATLNIPGHWMSYFFEAALKMEYQKNEESMSIFKILLKGFPESTHILAQIANCSYNMRDFKSATKAYEEVRKKDLHRLDSMDNYSNILYVREDANALSTLARQATRTDKFAPETACIVGNYFGLKSEHEKAVTYFRRALSLNKNFSPAWILMGHEFMELKNTPLAIDAYRSAVNINQRDYRAWYGLGQTYELLNLHFYALYYYWRAMMLRHKDSRMWCAMAGCYEAMDQKAEAKKCYERAVFCGDFQGVALPKLTKLCDQLGEKHKSKKYYEDMVNTMSQQNSYSRDPRGDY